MSVKNCSNLFREGSIIAKMYSEIANGAIQPYSTFHARWQKRGLKKPRQLVMRICRILRRNQTGLMVSCSIRNNEIFVTKFIPADVKSVVRRTVKKVAAKPVAKKVVSKKPVAKKTKTAMHIVREANKQTKAAPIIPVLAGGLEEE